MFPSLPIMSSLFPEPELIEISTEIEMQLREVRELEAIAIQKTGETPSTEVVLAKQNQAIADLQHF